MEKNKLHCVLVAKCVVRSTIQFLLGDILESSDKHPFMESPTGVCEEFIQFWDSCFIHLLITFLPCKMAHAATSRQCAFVHYDLLEAS